MQRLIFIGVLIFASTAMGMQNTVKSLDNCSEFKEKSDYYYDKSDEKKSKFARSRYKVIGKYYKMMYNDCVKKIEEHEEYQGYRDNIIQQKQ